MNFLIFNCIGLFFFLLALADDVYAAVIPTNPNLGAPVLNGSKNGTDIVLKWNPICSNLSNIYYTIQESVDEETWVNVYTGTGHIGTGTIASVPALVALNRVTLPLTEPEICITLPGDARSIVLFNRGSASYYYRIQSCSDLFCGQYSSTISLLSAPASPSSIMLSKVSGSSYKVTWQSLVDGASYELQKRINGQNFSTIYSGPLLYKNESLTSGLYQYRVRSCIYDSNRIAYCSSYILSNELFVSSGVNVAEGMLHYEYDSSGRLRAVLDANN